MKKLTKTELKEFIWEQVSWDEIGQQAERNVLTDQLARGLEEDEKLKVLLIASLRQRKDMETLKALKRLESMIRVKGDMVDILAMKTTPYVNE